MLRFIHISDTHIGRTKNFLCHGVNTYQKFEETISYINNLELDLDLVIHTGDLIGEDSIDSYELLHSLVKKIKCPFLCVAGNYDCQETLNKMFLRDNNDIQHFGQHNSYYLEFKNNLLVFLNSSTYPDSSGKVHEEDILCLKTILKSTAKPCLFFIHFPALPIDCPWVERDMLLTNGKSFHSLIQNYKEKVVAVFHGHIHKAITNLKDGILYSSTASTFCQYPAWSNNTEPDEEVNIQHCFNLVSVESGNLVIKNCSF